MVKGCEREIGEGNTGKLLRYQEGKVCKCQEEIFVLSFFVRLRGRRANFKLPYKVIISPVANLLFVVEKGEVR